MTSMRLSAKTLSRRARAYRGTDGAVAKPEVELTPVTADRPACPHCGGGVRLVGATFSDKAAGITFRRTKVYGSHAYGGGKAQYGVTCPGAGSKYVGD